MFDNPLLARHCPCAACHGFHEEPVSSTLIYPLATEPETGTGAAIEIAPGIMWLRMPLFASLKWINVWIIADKGGWAIVDTGLRSAQTMEAWQTAFATIMPMCR